MSIGITSIGTAASASSGTGAQLNISGNASAGDMVIVSFGASTPDVVIAHPYDSSHTELGYTGHVQYSQNISNEIAGMTIMTVPSGCVYIGMPSLSISRVVAVWKVTGAVHDWYNTGGSGFLQSSNSSTTGIQFGMYPSSIGDLVVTTSVLHGNVSDSAGVWTSGVNYISAYPQRTGTSTLILESVLDVVTSTSIYPYSQATHAVSHPWQAFSWMIQQTFIARSVPSSITLTSSKRTITTTASLDPGRDYDYSESVDNPVSRMFEVKLSPINEPVSGTPYCLRYRYRKTDPQRQVDITAALYQGSTEIASFTHLNVDNAFVQKASFLTTAQQANITNRTDLRVRMTATSTGTGTNVRARVSWICLEAISRFGRPIQDIASGNWSASPLFTKVDEDAPG